MQPRCSETRARDGQPCTAPATVNGKCAGHAGLGVAANPTENATLSHAVRQNKARLRNMNAQDHLAAQLEKHAETITNAVINSAAEGDMQAVRFIYERAYGKPTERVEHVDTSRSLADMSAGERAELRRRLVADNPELLELVPRGVTGADGLVEPKTALNDV